VAEFLLFKLVASHSNTQGWYALLKPVLKPDTLVVSLSHSCIVPDHKPDKARKPPEAVVDSCLGRDAPPKVGLGLVMNLASTTVGARDPVRLLCIAGYAGVCGLLADGYHYS
jgi:hypothetical protein